MPLNPHIAALLSRRGIADEYHEEFIAPSYERDIHDPFLFDDMPRAVERICSAIANAEHVTIYGDYDVDGVSSAVIIFDVLTRAHAHVSLFFNHREEDGYGLHRHCIDTIAEQGTTLIITTDSGIANAGEVAYAHERGIDTIITDHHTPPSDAGDIPPAVAIIHPQVHADRYPWKALSGGGSAFKLAQALCRTFAVHNPTWLNEEKWLLDLVALSTLSDCVSLQGENRALLHYGLKVIQKTRRPGLRTLLNRVPSFYQSSLIDSLHYFVIPLLNAASRMDHASRAAAVLTAPDEHTASDAVDFLEAANRERQKLTTKTVRAVPGNILVNGALFLAASSSWRLGVLGLVANKLVAHYGKPVLLVRSGTPHVGVCRSTPDIHIAKTLARLSDCFDRFGGHHGAGGFALKESVSLEEFAQAIELIEPVREKAGSDNTFHDRKADCAARMTLIDFTDDYIRGLVQCEPWGPGNPPPVYAISDCVIRAITPVGTRGHWVRLRIEQGESRMSVRVRTALMPLRDRWIAQNVDLVCEGVVRQWRGVHELALTVNDIALHAEHHEVVTSTI